MRIIAFHLLSVLVLAGVYKPQIDSSRVDITPKFFSVWLPDEAGVYYDSIQNRYYKVYLDSSERVRIACEPLDDINSRFTFPGGTFVVYKILNGIFHISNRYIDQFGSDGAVKNDGTVIFDLTYDHVHLTPDTVVGAYLSSINTNDSGTVTFEYYDIQTDTSVIKNWNTPFFSEARIEDGQWGLPIYTNINEIYKTYTDDEDPSWIIRNNVVVNYFQSMYYAFHNDPKRSLDFLYKTLEELENPSCQYHDYQLFYECIHQNIEVMNSFFE